MTTTPFQAGAATMREAATRAAKYYGCDRNTEQNDNIDRTVNAAKRDAAYDILALISDLPLPTEPASGEGAVGKYAMSEAWCRKMAELEAGQEISAGIKHPDAVAMFEASSEVTKEARDIAKTIPCLREQYYAGCLDRKEPCSCVRAVEAAFATRDAEIATLRAALTSRDEALGKAKEALEAARNLVLSGKIIGAHGAVIELTKNEAALAAIATLTEGQTP